MIRQDKVQRIERIQWTLEKEDHTTFEVLVVKGLMGIYGISSIRGRSRSSGYLKNRSVMFSRVESFPTFELIAYK